MLWLFCSSPVDFFKIWYNQDPNASNSQKKKKKNAARNLLSRFRHATRLKILSIQFNKNYNMTYNSCGCSAALNGLFVFKIKYDAKKICNE